MARTQNTKRRYTEPGKHQTDSPKDNGIKPLRNRRPFMFWFVVIGTLAMVLSAVSSLILALTQ